MADDNTAHYYFGAWDFNASGCFRRSIDAVILNDNDSCKRILGTDVESDFTKSCRKGRAKGAVQLALHLLCVWLTTRKKFAGLLDQVRLVEKYEALAANVTGTLLDL